MCVSRRRRRGYLKSARVFVKSVAIICGARRAYNDLRTPRASQDVHRIAPAWIRPRAPASQTCAAYTKAASPEPRARRAREAREALETQHKEAQAASHAAKMAKAAQLAASSRAERVDKVRDHLQRVDDAVKLAKKLDANSPAKRWATIMAKADAPSAPAAKSERLPPLAVAVAVVAAAYVVRALFAKE